MKEISSMLMKLCTENVYSDNIFHLLGLTVNATQKDIRRRREDVEAANALGENSWKSEFKYLFGSRTAPSFEVVVSGFNDLETDPVFRIFSEFFWVWPTSASDSSVKEIISGDWTNIIKGWESESLGVGSCRIIAQHNLAVIYHFYAIDAEQQMLDKMRQNATLLHDCDWQKLKVKASEYWDKAFFYWEEIVKNEEFWDRVVARIESAGEPRLKKEMAEKIREDVPVAFDNINAGFALAYARINKFEEAKRHVDYMAKTMRGLDDIDESFKIVFEPMERRVALLVARYDEQAKEVAESAKKCVEKLLGDTEEIRRVASALLAEGHRLRLKLFDDIVSACNRYQVIYSNATNDWKGCSEILAKLKDMDMSESLRHIINENRNALLQNIKDEEEAHTCWCCKKRMGRRDSYTVPMYGNVYPDAARSELQAALSIFVMLELKSARGYGYQGYGYQSIENMLRRQCPRLGCVRFDTIQIKVPCCPACASTLTWGKVKDYPSIARLVSEGFKLGNKPDDYDALSAWGVAHCVDTIHKHVVSDDEKADGSRETVMASSGSGGTTGCLVPVVIVIALALAGCMALFH